MSDKVYRHIRFRKNAAYDTNVEDFIKSIEVNFAIDFRSLPQWESLIRNLHKTLTYRKKKVRDANFRKLQIINTIYEEWCRPSPFTLTDSLFRTSKKWNQHQEYQKEQTISVKSEPSVCSYTTILKEKSNGESETAHPNTEIVPSEENVFKEEIKINSEANIQIDEPLPKRGLPICLVSNLHKYVSPLDSKDDSITGVTIISTINTLKLDVKENEWLLLNQTSLVKCFPKQLIINDTSLEEQSIQFSLKNCAFEQLHVRFKCVTDKSAFKIAKVFPVTSTRLCPGIEIMFKFVFILSQYTEDFTSNIYFKVGRKILSEIAAEAVCIPIVSKFNTSRSASVSEFVSISPVYTWQIKYGYPKTAVTVLVSDNNEYDVHITKRIIDFTYDFDNRTLSLEAIGPNTESIGDRTVDSEIIYETKILNLTNHKLPSEAEIIAVIASSVMAEIIDRSLDTFLFEKTYLHMKPHTKRNVNVILNQAEHIGMHQCYYDFEFYDTETKNRLLKRTVKIFAEVLPHPVRIDPIILDLSQSPITHGFCKDIFKVTNTHKLYPATIKIRLTSKMQKVFRITPMEVVIPTTSTVNFEVMFCSTEWFMPQSSNDLVLFTLKIIISGNKSVYNNVPPVFYEMIAPCALEFKKIYNKKFFKEPEAKSLTNTDKLEES